MTNITKPGVYDLPEDEYHRDPVVEPSLSSSIAKVLLAKSPAHARLAHPRLNPDFEPEEKKEWDLGKLAHKLMLGKGAELAIIRPKDCLKADGSIPDTPYQTKKGKQARDDAHAEGLIPVLESKLEEVEAMVKAGRAQLDRHDDSALAFLPGAGEAEKVIVWKEGEIWCRLMLDWLPNGGTVYWDYKTTGQSANPDDFERTLFNLQYQVQSGIYRRGIRAVLGIQDPKLRFLVQETSPPYAICEIALDPEAEALGDAMAAEAIRRWTWCITHNSWPGYPRRTCYVSAPVWELKKWESGKHMQQDAIEAGTDLLALGMEMQAPIEEGKADDGA